MTKLELAETLERFLGGDSGQGFSAFSEVKTTPELEPYRRRILEAWGDGWTDADELRNIINELKVAA